MLSQDRFSNTERWMVMGMREKLIGLLDDALLSVNWDSHDYPDTDSAAEILIANDVLPVVRCKDCKHSVWDEENEMWKCVESAYYDEDSGEWFGFYEYHNGDFFCADGERKDNG